MSRVPAARAVPTGRPTRAGSRPSMPRRGSRRSPAKRSGEALALALGAVLMAPPASAEALAPYVVAGDGIAAPLTGRPGDPVKGRQVVASRQVGLCLLCHAGPFPEERFQGTIGPDLAGVGARLGPAQLRLRLV